MNSPHIYRTKFSRFKNNFSDKKGVRSILKKSIFTITTMLITTNVWAGACNNASFQDFYNGVKHAGNGNPAWVRLDKTPNNYGAFNNDCFNNTTTGGCFDLYGKRYEIVATSGVTTKWSAAVCGRVLQNAFTYNREHRVFLNGGVTLSGKPRVQFQYRQNNGSWAILPKNGGGVASFEFSINNFVQDSAIRAFRWKWSSSTPRQYRMVVERAMKWDQFDFIMDW